jgi:putative MFS transporter
MTVQQAIDAIGYGRFQRRMLVVCGVTWAADAAEVLVIGFALPAIRAEFHLDDVTSGLLATVTFVGMLLGAWLWGVVADRIGRRAGFMLTVAIFAVFGLLSAFAPNVGWLLVLRLLTGFGLGGALPLDFALYAEFLPSRGRGHKLVLLESFWARPVWRGSWFRRSGGDRCSRCRRWPRCWCCGSGRVSRSHRAISWWPGGPQRRPT